MRIREQFEATGDASACLRERSELIDLITSRLYADFLSADLSGPQDLSLAAVGGYGRRELFPFSDVDLLFVCRSERNVDHVRQQVASFARALWDMRVRVGHSLRTIADCSQLHSDNLEFDISLLDIRYLAGDLQLFEKLRSEAIPHMVRRDQQDLTRNLMDLTARRHEKQGRTIFQLEPNVKDAPGGLRDYGVARWLTQIRQMAELARWPAPGTLAPASAQEEIGRSWRFLSAIRCFLHYERGRDDNLLTYELQERAAARGIGTGQTEPADPAERSEPGDAAQWMRAYFRNTRMIDRWTRRLIEDASYPQSSLYRLFQDWRSRLSNTEFSVIRGKIFPRVPVPQRIGPVLGLFEMTARHGLDLSQEAEQWVGEYLRVSAGESPDDQESARAPISHARSRKGGVSTPPLAHAPYFLNSPTLNGPALRDRSAREGKAVTSPIPAVPQGGTRPSVVASEVGEKGGQALAGSEAWPALRRILALPESARALRAMHGLGLLTALVPEFSAIDALVIHDFYHRYTVDEHSFMAVQNVCALRRDQYAVRTGEGEEALTPWVMKLGELYSEIEQPELLSLALIIHDVGKGMDVSDHVEGSLRAARGISTRLGLEPSESGTVLFLIARHLEMSATLRRRDIFDPETIRSFAEKVGTPERLKLLCLLTYADLRAVNPEALTPWKAEMLWQLYTMTSNYLSRSLDENRLPSDLPATTETSRVLSLLGPEADSDHLNAFLGGFPRRYLETHSPEEIAGHFELARRISQSPVQARVRRRPNYYELVVVAADQPYLFASISGALAGWGMSILKAEAFANHAGLVVDVLRFHDLHRTLELNPPEIPRLEQNLADVLTGRVSLQQVMAGRMRAGRSSQAKVKIVTQISFDNSASCRCTLLEIITQDHPGLLYEISSVLADAGCNIEVALIDTESERAIDVFYLTAGGQRLSRAQQEEIRLALLKRSGMMM